MPVCSANASVSRSSAGTSPKSSSAFGRSSTARRRTSWSAVTTCSRSSAERRAPGGPRAPPRAASARAGSRSAPARSRRGARARAAAARAPAPRTTRRNASRATRCDSSTATAARAANVSASRRSSSEKRGVGAVLVVDLETPIARSRAISGTHMPVRAPGAPRHLLVAPRDRRSPSRLARCAVARAPRRSSSAEREMLVPSRSSAARRPRRRTGARRLPLRQRERDDAALRAARAGGGRRDRADASRSVSVASAFPTSFSDCELARPAGGRLVEPGVLDRRPRPGRRAA